MFERRVYWIFPANNKDYKLATVNRRRYSRVRQSPKVLHYWDTCIGFPNNYRSLVRIPLCLSRYTVSEEFTGVPPCLHSDERLSSPNVFNTQYRYSGCKNNTHRYPMKHITYQYVRVTCSHLLGTYTTNSPAITPSWRFNVSLVRVTWANTFERFAAFTYSVTLLLAVFYWARVRIDIFLVSVE